MFGLGIPETAIIVVVVVIFLFLYAKDGKGGEKVSGLARGLGRFTGEFKKGKMEIEGEIKKAEKEPKEDEIKSDKKIR